MKKSIAWIALAVAFPTVALADGDNQRVLEQYNAMMRDGRAQQAAEEGRANVEAFRRLQEAERAQREAPTNGAYASGRNGERHR